MKNLRTFCSPLALPAVTAALAAAGLVSSATAAVQTAGDLLVNVDATSLPAGPLSSVANAGTMAGVFEAGGSGASVAAVYGTGTKGILFDGNGFMQHKVAVAGALVPADPGLTGVPATTSIEAWVLNPSIPGEETIVSWGHRNGGDGQNMSFNYGYDARWGAVGHWGSPDIGWDSCCNSTGGAPPGVPAAGVWHHLVYTFDGTTQRIYVDGVLKNSENVGLNIHAAPPITIAGQLEDDAGNVTGALRGSLTIGRLRIHQEALSAAQVANNYGFEVADFTGAAAFSTVAPIHRYRFANAAGGAPSGTVVTDSIGTAHGTVLGDGSTATGTRIALPGGSGNGPTLPYIDLPNGLLSINSADAPTAGSGQITFEGWTKVTGARTWSRIMDIGSSDIADPGLIGGQVPGPGGGGEGLDYLFYSAQEGDNTGRRVVDIRNIDGGPGPNGHPGATGNDGGVGFDTPNFGRDNHWAITWNESSGIVRVYENGNEVGSRTGAPRFSAINDVNVWLGRSNWTGDQNANAEYDEFRIYNKELTAEEVARSAQAGAAALHLPGQIPSFDANPLSQTVQEQFPVTFSVETKGQQPMSYQWYKGANPIPGATGLSLTFIAVASDNGAQFKLVAQNALGSTDSTVATLTVLADTTRPTLVGAAGGTAWGLNDTLFGVRFSEAVNTADAQNAANYSMAGYTILGPGVLQPDNVTVVFGVTPTLKTSTCKTLAVSNVRDRAPSQNAILPNSQTGVIYAEGTIRYHRFNNSGAGFPDLADVIANPPRVENPEGGGDHGDSYRGQGLWLLSPPVTGNYKFYIASDDNSTLYISTDENPANKVQIAREPAWAGFRAYTGIDQDGNAANNQRDDPPASLANPSNISAPISLTAGCRYYMEFVFNEGGGGDYCSVAWQTPASGPNPGVPPNGSDPIGAQYISPFQKPATIAVTDPVDQTLSEGARATLTANITGSPNLTIQWYSNGVAIVGATGPTHQTPSLRFPDNNGDQYRVEAQNSLGLAVSRTATITVVDDATPPTVSRVVAGPLLDRFTVIFNEIMDAATAEDEFNYLINGTDFPSMAILSPDGVSVTLVYGPQMPDTIYLVHVETVADFAGNPIASIDIPVRSAVPGCGGLVFEAYNAGGGNAVSVLTTHPSFPNSPDYRGVINTFRSRVVVDPANPTFYNTDAREAYGARMRGLLVAPESGAHTFYLAADDNAELWLSTDANPANRVRIATETAWSNEREWTSSAGASSVPNKKSPPINLIAGQAYYIEALYKEGGGGDHCAVAVQTPSQGAPPANGAGEITSAIMGDSAPAGAVPPVVFNTQPASQTVMQNSVVSFSATTSRPAPFDWLPVTYQWQRSDDDGATWNPIPNATGLTYSFGPALLSDDGAQFRVEICSIGQRQASTNAILDVMPDTTPPSCVSARVQFLTNVVIRFSEFVSAATAEDEFNYSVNGDFPALATLMPDGMSVRLLLNTPLPIGGVPVTVESMGVTDLADNAEMPCSLQILTPVLSCGFVYFEAYNTPGQEFQGTAVSMLTSHPNYPYNPDFTAYLGGFNSTLAGGIYANNGREQYGGRVSGYFIPAVSGNYIFYIRSDDASDLYFSAGGDLALIANEPGCCAGFSAHPSAPIALTAGQPYPIMALYKEGGGGDYVQVAAKLESDPTNPDLLQPLSGAQIASLADSTGASVTITRNPCANNICLPVPGVPPVTGGSPLATQDFNSGNGGCTVTNANAPFEGPWTYNAGSGSWRTAGQGPELGRAPSTRLTCPPVSVTQAGNVTVSFNHRYSFEAGAWDGGLIQVSVNGGAFNTVPNASFSANGYNGIVLAGSAAELRGQAAFIETSAGYGSGTMITSTAALGCMSAGDTISVRFVASYDTNTRQNDPAWEIDSISLAQAVSGGTTATFGVDATASGPIFIQWERSVAGGPFVALPGATGSLLSFVPTLADNGNCYRAAIYTPGIACGATPRSQAACLSVEQPNTPPRFTKGADDCVDEDSAQRCITEWATAITAHSIPRVPTLYSNNFSSGAAGMQLAGSATVADGALKLTTPVNSIYGAGSITAPVQTYETLQVSWKSYLGDGASSGADGYSLNIGDDLPVDPGYGGEEGTGSKLTVTVDTFDNGLPLDPCQTGIELKWGGAVLACASIPKDNPGDGNFLRKSQFVDASVSVDATGLATFTYDGNTISAPLPSYAGVRASRALFWARTGGANDNQWIDDFNLAAFPYDASSAEAGQTVKFVVSNNNPGLFSAQPAISPDGTLCYTPAPNACGNATVTVVAMDNGGIGRCGGSDMSAPQTFTLCVRPLNDCPVTANVNVDVNEDSSVAITIPVSDADVGTACGAAPPTCSVVSGPSQGTLSGSCPNFVYTPTPGQPAGCNHNNGADSFVVAITDGACTVQSTVNIRIIEVNDCPDANIVVTKLHPVPGLDGRVVIACNSNGCFILNGTSSSDAECDQIAYAWYYGNSPMPFSVQPITTNCFPIGEHDITLVVGDGQCTASETVHIIVLTPCEAIEALIDDINNSVIERKNKRPLLASLKAACASFERGSFESGKNQLGAFINKVRAQISRDNPVEAARWTAAAQSIIDSVNTCEELYRTHGNNGSGNGEDPPPPGWQNPGNPHFGDPPHDP